MIGIVDYSVNNIKSVASFFQREDIPFRVVSQPKDLALCERIIIPGVGAFKRGMQCMDEKNFIEPLAKFANSGKYILGICLGMQLLFESSEENGKSDGLQIIKGCVVPISSLSKPKIHMGWNEISLLRPSRILDSQVNLLDVYFAHSYHCQPLDKTIVTATCNYSHEIIAAIEYDNVFGLQFHPEKSQIFGSKILKKFSQLPC
jgi:glutamine amidotransferase